MSTNNNDKMLVSYRALRRFIGLIGILLPIALVALDSIIAREFTIRDSISSYYWAATADHVLIGSVFIGSLCSIGVFLWSYCGDAPFDSRAGNVACIAAVLVALCPCSPINGPEVATRYIHFPAAGVLFLLLAYFCLLSFPGQDPGTTKTRLKPVRNGIYIGCGIAILACILAIAALHVIYDKNPPGSSVFWLESIAIWAFGWSWYIKGQGLGVVQDAPQK